MDNIQLVISISSILIGVIAAAVSYLNYRLNKTLHIKNLLYANKNVHYLEVTKVISELVALLDRGTINLYTYRQEEFFALAAEFDEKAYQLNYLFTKSHLIVPNHILKKINDLIEILFKEIREGAQVELKSQYFEQDYKLRELAVNLIHGFRKDLAIDKLNIKA